MKTPKKENISAANQIHDMMLTWDRVDKILYSEFESFPRNSDPKEVAYKVTLVDRLYTCNLKVDFRLVVNHIISLNSDSAL